jgi:hypothetical protein
MATAAALDAGRCKSSGSGGVTGGGGEVGSGSGGVSGSGSDGLCVSGDGSESGSGAVGGGGEDYGGHAAVLAVLESVRSLSVSYSGQ